MAQSLRHCAGERGPARLERSQYVSFKAHHHFVHLTGSVLVFTGKNDVSERCTQSPRDAEKALAEQSPLFFEKIPYFLQPTERHVWDKCSQSGGKHLSKELWARKCLWMGLSLQKVRQFGPKPLPHMQNSKLLCMPPSPTVPRVAKMISIRPA